MKNSSIYSILILLLLVAGCKNFNFSSSEKSSVDQTGKRAPIQLKAKTIEELPAPENATLLPVDETRKKRKWEKKSLRLKTGAAVFDVLHFYRREMERLGWRNDPSNESRAAKEPRIPRVHLKFENQSEEVGIDIRQDGDDGSEINILVLEKINRQDSSTEIPLPMPSCADGRNIITNESGMSITAGCGESLMSVAKFYEEMMPQSAWNLKNRTGDAGKDETVTMIYTKENRTAAITLVREGEKSTYVNVRIGNKDL